MWDASRSCPVECSLVSRNPPVPCSGAGSGKAELEGGAQQLGRPEQWRGGAGAGAELTGAHGAGRLSLVSKVWAPRRSGAGRGELALCRAPGCAALGAGKPGQFRQLAVHSVHVGCRGDIPASWSVRWPSGQETPPPQTMSSAAGPCLPLLATGLLSHRCLHCDPRAGAAVSQRNAAPARGAHAAFPTGREHAVAGSTRAAR